jgi:iron(III) transport system permease protein
MQSILKSQPQAAPTTDWHFPRVGRLPILTLLTLLILGLLLLPIAYLSVRAVEGGQDGIDYLLRPRTTTIIKNSIQLVAAVALSTTLIGVPFGWLTSRTDLPLRRVWLVLGTLPMVTPSYVLAVALVMMFGPTQMFKNTFGFNPFPQIYGFFGAWLVITLLTYPYVALPVRAAFLKMDSSLEEAARGLGLNRWQVFLRVTFPQLRPALAGGVLLASLYALSDFGAVMILRFNAFTRAIYVSYENSFNPNRAAVLSLVLVVLTLALLGFERWVARSHRNYKVGTGVSRQPETVKLGIWRWPALAFCLILVGLGVVMPVVVLAGWALNPNVTSSLQINLQSLSINTIGVSALAAVVAGIVALPLAILGVRAASYSLRNVVNMAYVGNALPGVVVGLALVYFGIRVVPDLYQTLPILIFGYLVRFVPFTLVATRGALTQINPSLEEAARGLGLKGWQVALRVTLPMAWASVMAGMVLVFLNGMKELPTTLMLRPTGFDTLATRIWTASELGSHGLIGAPGLVLIGVSFLSLTVILWRDKLY